MFCQAKHLIGLAEFWNQISHFVKTLALRMLTLTDV